MSERYDKVAQQLHEEQSSYLRKVNNGRSLVGVDRQDDQYTKEAEDLRQMKAIVSVDSLESAKQSLGLTKQEEGLYKRHLNNLYGSGKVMNSNGSISTLYQITVENNGKTYSIPTVYNGKIVETDAAIQMAGKIGWNKFPSYATAAEAEARYQQMHTFMEKDTAQYLTQQKNSKSFKSITGATAK